MLKSKRVIFFAQDEGSAKALAPVIRQWAERDDPILMVRARGAAADAFNRMGIHFTISEPGNVAGDFSPRPDLIITGASMRASIEKEAIRFARSQGNASVTLLDSPLWPWWRFTVDGTQDLSALPDHILVPDPNCKERMGADGFPADRLMATGNPHFDTVIERGRAVAADRPGGILIISQPRYEDGAYISDLNWLQSVLGQCHRQAPEIPLIIRPHGKEDAQFFLSLGSDRVRVDRESDILDLMASQTLIIGKNSSALLEGLIMGIPVITYSNSPAEFLEDPFGDQGALIQALDDNGLAGALRTMLKETKSRRVPSGKPFYTDGLNRRRVMDFLDGLMQKRME